MSREMIDILRQVADEPNVYTMPDNFEEAQQAAIEFSTFIVQPGFKRLLDAFEAEGNRRLAALRGCTSHDPVVIKDLRDRWAVFEEVMLLIQTIPQEAIANAEMMSEELRLALELDADKTEIREYMRTHAMDAMFDSSDPEFYQTGQE